MNWKMQHFIVEVATKGVKFGVDNRSLYDIGFFNPYNQFPKWKHSGLSSMDKRFIKEHGSNYRLYPEQSRPGIGGAYLAVITPAIIPAVAVTSTLAAGYGQSKAIQEIVENPSVPTQDKISWLRY